MDTQTATPASLIERVRYTFLAPGRLGVALRDNGPWIDVLLISTLIAVASIASVPDEVFVRDMEDAVTRRGQPVEVVSSPEEIGRWGRFMGMLATVGTYPVIPFVLAGIVFVVLTLLFRSKTSYRQLLAIASHAMLIPAAGTILRVIGRGAGIEFITPDPGWSFLLTAVLAIDPYIVWMLLVIGVAASAIDTRLSGIRTGAVLVIGYVALVFGTTALLHPPSDEVVTSYRSPDTWAPPKPAIPGIG